jgi:Domain of unknown function (DUF1844)
MSEDKEERRSFEVKDRRRFSETGEARSDAPDAPESPPPSASPTEPTPRPAGASGAAPGAEHEHEDPVNFSTFVLGLSTQVLFLLGEIPNPETQLVERDLAAAKQVIDILGILREKTRNNLEPSEEALLDSILYDLRMRYVELKRSGPKEGA